MARNPNPVNHNDIEYYGIATYGDINEGAGSIIFTESLDRCLSKQVADIYKGNGFTYLDDTPDDPNRGKLLKYKNITFDVTIPIIIYNNKDSYTVLLDSCTIKFAENIDDNDKSFEETLQGTPVYIDPSNSETFNVLNNRRYMRNPASTTTGTISLTITIKGQTLDWGLNGIANVPITCHFQYVANGTASSVFIPNKLPITSGANGSFTYTYTVELSWIKDNLGNITYLTSDLNNVWPDNAEKIWIQINAVQQS